MLWVGCTLCVLILVAFVVSGWWLLTLQIPTSHGPVLMVRGGMLWLAERRWLLETFHAEPGNRLSMASADGPDWLWWNYCGISDSGGVQLPLYAVFLAVAIPTLLVRRFAPKFPRGHCRRRGYNLKRLTEARCPECGEGFDARQREGNEDL